MRLTTPTTFDADTPDGVKEVLDRYTYTRFRLRIWYGDRNTGKSWGDAETGYIGRSTGPVKVPLLIANQRSHGGPAILTACIVRIDHANKRNGGTLWEHPDFHAPCPECGR